MLKLIKDWVVSKQAGQLRILGWLLIMAGLVYLPALANQFVWDDEQFIQRNVTIQAFDIRQMLTENTVAAAGVLSNYYRPLTSLSLAWDYQFWKLNPFGYHLTSVVLHLLAGSLLWLLLTKLRLNVLLRSLVVLAFLLHPVQTEVVAYTNARAASLYTIFALLSAWCLLESLQTKVKVWQLYNLQVKLSWQLFWLFSLVCLVASILAQEIGLATLGLWCLIGLVLQLQLGQEHLANHWRWRWLGAVVMGVLICGAYLVLRAGPLNFYQTFAQPNLPDPAYQHIAVRLLTFTHSVWEYLKLIVWPYPLHMERTLPLITSVKSIYPWLTLALLGLSALGGWLEKRQLQTVWIWFGTLWALAFIFPVSGVVPVSGILYEHWLYLPLVGVVLALLRLLQLMFRLLRLSVSPTVITILVTLWAILASGLTIRQIRIWANPISLYSHTLKYAQTTRLYNNLALAYADEGEIGRARQMLENLVEFQPTEPEIYHNLGNLYQSEGKISAAIKAYQRAVELSPNFAPAYPKLIRLLQESGDASNSARYSEKLRVIGQSR